MTTIDITPTQDEQLGILRMFADDIINHKVKAPHAVHARALLAQVADLAFIAGANAALRGDLTTDQRKDYINRRRTDVAVAVAGKR